jgi:CheY-like chemotaxis protein
LTPLPPLVLVVDDEPNILELVSMRLRQYGYDVTTATTGTQALDVAQATRPDCIVVDGRMPEMDGHEMTQRLRANPDLHSTPVLMLSAASHDGWGRFGDDGSADAYLRKPFTPEELKEAIAMLLSTSADPNTDGGDGREP